MVDTYEGRPCKRCTATRRYTSTRHCVACDIVRTAPRRARPTAPPKEQAPLVDMPAPRATEHFRLEDPRWYRGGECYHCGHFGFARGPYVTYSGCREIDEAGTCGNPGNNHTYQLCARCVAEGYPERGRAIPGADADDAYPPWSAWGVRRD